VRNPDGLEFGQVAAQTRGCGLRKVGRGEKKSKRVVLFFKEQSGREKSNQS